MSLRKRKPPPRLTTLQRLASICCTIDPEAKEERRRSLRHISWDEKNITQHFAERGVLYATMVIDEGTTPFLQYDSRMSRDGHEITEVGPGHLKTTIDISQLQTKLGILVQSENQGIEVLPTATRNLAVMEENKRRREMGEILKTRRYECSAGAAMAFRSKVGDDDDANSEGDGLVNDNAREA